MSVASKNPFALLGDDDGPVAAAPAKKNDSTSAPSGGRSQREIPGAASSRGANNASRPAGGRGGARNVGFSAAGGEAEGRSDSRDVRSAGRGRGAGRGASRGRGRGGRGREFDRHSQTARVDSDKAIAQGWGGDDAGRELEAEKKAEEDAAAEEKSGAVTPADGEAPKENGEAADASAAPAAPVEEVDNTKTLDEYLAEQAERKARLGAPAKSLRTAEEWKEGGQKVTKRSEEEESYIAAAHKESAGAKSQRERKEKQLMEIDTYFESPSQDRGARGGGRGGRDGRGASRGESRGGDRGSRGRGAGRGAGRGGAGAGRGGRGGASNSVNLDDNRAFPSLGA